MGYVFISYSSKNRDSADAMRQILKKYNIKSWMAPHDIPAGNVYADVIIDALKNCSCVIFLLTDSAQKSQWVPKELERAVNYKKSIITIRMDEVVIKGKFELYLSDEQMVEVPRIDEKNEEIKKVIQAASVFTGAGEISFEQVGPTDKAKKRNNVTLKQKSALFSEPLIKSARTTLKKLNEEKNASQKYIYVSCLQSDLKKTSFRKNFDKLIAAIERKGIIVWLASKNIAPGKNYSIEISSAIKNCSLMLSFISSNYTYSMEAESEIIVARTSKRKVFPLITEQFEMNEKWKYILSSYQCGNFYDLDENEINSFADYIAAMI